MNNHALEARALREKIKQQNDYIDRMDERVQSLQHALNSSQIAEDQLAVQMQDYKQFVQFANHYYPGCIEQFKAIRKLEGENL